MNDPALDYREIYKSFDGKAVLKGLSLEVPYGELIGVFGRSGAGKSLLLRMAVGLELPDRGHIWFEGSDLATLDERDFFEVRCKISYVFQNGALFDSMTVEENLAFPLRLRHPEWNEERVLERVEERLALVGLQGTNALFPEELSGGMQKRVGLLRATMLDPTITLFDEPTAGLDPMNVRVFSQNVLQLKKTKTVTGLFVTHDIQCALAICDRIAILSEGRIYALETVDAIQRSTDPVILSFIDTDYAELDPLERARRGGGHAQADATAI